MRIIIIRLVPAPPPDARDPVLPASPAQPSGEATPRIDSSTLFGRARELVILHAGREYRLRVTQNGKLILTA
jgi:hemin uptake protein HemP